MRVVNRVVTVEQVYHGYVVVITPVEEEAFFDSFEDMMEKLKVYFKVKEKEK